MYKYCTVYCRQCYRTLEFLTQDIQRVPNEKLVLKQKQKLIDHSLLRSCYLCLFPVSTRVSAPSWFLLCLAANINVSNYVIVVNVVVLVNKGPVKIFKVVSGILFLTTGILQRILTIGAGGGMVCCWDLTL